MKSDTPPFLSAIGNEETAQLPAARFPGEIVVVDDVRAPFAPPAPSWPPNR